MNVLADRRPELYVGLSRPVPVSYTHLLYGSFSIECGHSPFFYIWIYEKSPAESGGFHGAWTGCFYSNVASGSCAGSEVS